jgi:hypothetical protein
MRRIDSRTYHLGHAYRKLGISSRHELAMALAPQIPKSGGAV